MPTLYDNFSQVKQYIEQEKPDLTSYVTKTELANASYATSSDLNDYLPLSGGTLSGNLFAGDQDKTTVTFLATRRKCGGESGTSYMASFFTNSDGRSKFAHKSYTGTKADVSNDVDDAFMCFNAYGFKIAYSGTQGVAASTEYDLLHSGNIGNLGYVTHNYLDPHFSVGGDFSDNEVYIEGDGLSIHSLDILELKSDTHEVYSYTLMPDNNNETLGTSDNAWNYTYTNNLYTNTAYLQDTSYSSSIVPKETNTYTLGDSTYKYANTYSGRYNTAYSTWIGSDSDYEFHIGVNGGKRYQMNMYQFYQVANPGTSSLGVSNFPWAYTYTSNIYADNAYITYIAQDTYTNNIIPAATDTYTLGDSTKFIHTLYSNRIQGNSSVNIRTGGNNRATFSSTAFRPMTANYDLGSSDYPWKNAYITNAYISNYNNFIWTGTAAEYSTLSDYTTYQFYLVQES